MGVEELSDGRQTRRSTRSSTKSQTPAPVTPPAAKKTPATPNSSRRGRKKKIEEEVSEETTEVSEEITEVSGESKNVVSEEPVKESIEECEAQPPKKRQKLSETIEKIEENSNADEKTDTLDGPSTTAVDNEVKNVTLEPEKRDSFEEKMDTDEPVVESNSSNAEAAEVIVIEKPNEETVSQSATSTVDVAPESEITSITSEDDSCKDQAQKVEISLEENKPVEAVPDSSEVILFEEKSSTELPTISNTAVTEEPSMTALVESSSDDVEENITKTNVDSTSNEATAETVTETQIPENVQEKPQETEAMDVDSSSVVPAAEALSSLNEIQQNDVEKKVSGEVKMEEKTISSTDDVETKIEMSQGEDGSIANN